jgi:hypothetical protein
MTSTERPEGNLYAEFRVNASYPPGFGRNIGCSRCSRPETNMAQSGSLYGSGIVRFAAQRGMSATLDPIRRPNNEACR